MYDDLTLIDNLASAVEQHSDFTITYNGLTFSIWYDQAIPVISVNHPISGVIYEELASDKPEVMAEMLAPWFNGV